MQRISKFVVRSTVLGGFAILAIGCVTAPPAAAQVTYQTERREHPNMARAVDQMVAAYGEMDRAPDTFGGQKAQAMQALRTAIISAKRALYFRMKMDDNALWHAP